MRAPPKRVAPSLTARGGHRSLLIGHLHLSLILNLIALQTNMKNKFEPKITPKNARPSPSYSPPSWTDWLPCRSIQPNWCPADAERFLCSPLGKSLWLELTWQHLLQSLTWRIGQISCRWETKTCFSSPRKRLWNPYSWSTNKYMPPSPIYSTRKSAAFRLHKCKLGQIRLGLLIEKCFV